MDYGSVGRDSEVGTGQVLRMLGWSWIMWLVWKVSLGRKRCLLLSFLLVKVHQIAYQGY